HSTEVALVAFKDVRSGENWRAVTPLSDAKAQLPIAIRLSGTRYCSMETHKGYRRSPARQLYALRNFRNNSNFCVCVALPRHQEDIFLVAGIERQRDRHSRENHRVIERNKH